MYEAAVKIAKHVKYASAGTFEFIVDGQGNFYFLEMNTRLQVEHPVTEWVTGVDLVAWQLLLASEEFQLPNVPERRGCSIEVRVYAEDPFTFLPAPGPLGSVELPSGPFVRTDSAFHEPGEVSLHYDPMISKISVWAATRDEAIDRMRVALDETRIQPPRRPDGNSVGSLRTNLSFLNRLVRNQDVRSGDTPTDLITRNPDLITPEKPKVSLEAALAVALHQLLHDSQSGLSTSAEPSAAASAWSQVARQEGVRS